MAHAQQTKKQANTNTVNAANAITRVPALTTQVLVKHPCANLSTRNAQRIAAVQAMRKAKNAARAAAYAAAQQALANQQAYQLAVQQLQAQYGITVTPAAPAPRANSATTQPSAAAINVAGTYYNPCKAVHALCVLHNGVRKAVLAACKQHGINPATAATQYNVWRKSNPQQ